MSLASDIVGGFWGCWWKGLVVGGGRCLGVDDYWKGLDLG
jgi:hypothetical protein